MTLKSNVSWTVSPGGRFRMKSGRDDNKTKLKNKKQWKKGNKIMDENTMELRVLFCFSLSLERYELG